ncbi:MAG: HD domain-containing protein [Oscillospiraceae bacterium]|nr:HD domain-containing protein [Oscillospiraceae bacterium]
MIDNILTLGDIRRDRTVQAWIAASDAALGVMNYTEHGTPHAERTAETAAGLLKTLGYPERDCELARIAGFLHDIGNGINRVSHAISGALLAAEILNRLGMPPEETAAVAAAIGNHDEQAAAAVTPVTAAVILADKSDVRRSRVREKDQEEFDIHDRVNYAAVAAELTVREEILSLAIQIDTEICAVMDYFEIFLGRMQLCRCAAEFLGKKFELVINETRML